MKKQETKYELLSKEENSLRKKHTYIQACLLLALCAISSVAVYATWTVIYRRNLLIPPKLLFDIPITWINRTNYYAEHIYQHRSHQYLSIKQQQPDELASSNSNNFLPNYTLKVIDNEKIQPSPFGNFISSKEKEKQLKNNENKFKLICYYTSPGDAKNSNWHLSPKDIDPFLCSHLNVGVFVVQDSEIVVEDYMKQILEEMKVLKKQNDNLKILVWVGGGNDESDGFKEMVANHANRKRFIQSLKYVLETYHLDGIDLDWEFPNGFTKERRHFSQLLHEIRREYQREHRTYLLSVAVAAPSTIVDIDYDVHYINEYADFVNVMTYDYHFYSRLTPFTGLNAPLYAHPDDHSFFKTLNINYTVNYWQSKGLERNKIIIGLPTYGHSFHLVNAFNTKLGAPAEDFGRVGQAGFVSYSEVCWFRTHNIYVTKVYDEVACSPYLFSGTEWISYEDDRSLECKTKFIKDNNYGGAMIFSLNCDDFNAHCDQQQGTKNNNFPLANKIHSILFDSK